MGVWMPRRSPRQGGFHEQSLRAEAWGYPVAPLLLAEYARAQLRGVAHLLSAQVKGTRRHSAGMGKQR
jgi:hypothetical protein